MWNSLLAFWDQYHGLVISFAVLGLVVLANLIVYRLFWTDYPTREAYLAAHPGCNTPDGVVCARCGQISAGMTVPRAGRIYRCTRCDTDLYRVDRA
jgi:hypothetical protein